MRTCGIGVSLYCLPEAQFQHSHMHVRTTPSHPPLHVGSARGIGLCSARLMAQLGATLFMADIDTRGLQAAVEGLRSDVPG